MTAPRTPSVPVAVTAVWRAQLVQIAEDLDWLLPADAASRRLRDITREMEKVERDAIGVDRRPERRAS